MIERHNRERGYGSVLLVAYRGTTPAVDGGTGAMTGVYVIPVLTGDITTRTKGRPVWDDSTSFLGFDACRDISSGWYEQT